MRPTHDTDAVPEHLAELVVALLAPVEGVVYVPCCDSGDLLAALQAAAVDGVDLYGQANSERGWDRCQQRFGDLDIDVDLGSGPAPQFEVDRHPELRAHRVACVAPVRAVGARHVVPRAGTADGRRRAVDLDWLTVCLDHLAPHGVAAVVLPVGGMFRPWAEHQIRRRLVLTGVLECVVALPPWILSWGWMPLSVWVLRHDRDLQVHDVLLVDASRLGVPRTNDVRTSLDQAGVERVVRTYRSYRSGAVLGANVPGFSRVVTAHEIDDAGFELTPMRYIDPLP